MVGMMTCVVMTVLAPDRTGIVKLLSETVTDHGGSWLESRMARMAGQFAGILRVECEQSGVEALLEALAGLEAQGLTIQAKCEDVASPAERCRLNLDVVGNDCPGIVRSLSTAIAAAGANIDDLHTSLESAPMSGQPIFHAVGVVSLLQSEQASQLIESIEALGDDLAVTLD